MQNIKNRAVKLADKRTLFLQGPVGNFFKLLAQYMQQTNTSTTYQITFNGGDEWFSGKENTTPFLGLPSQWRAFLNSFITRHQITDIVVFGDCRFYHRIAKRVARELGLSFWVFEEGYLRPSFITIENQGTNANSSFSKSDMDNIESFPKKTQGVDEIILPNAFWYMTFSAIQYYFFKLIKINKYRFYIHHRPNNIMQELKSWVFSGIRKVKYKVTEASLATRLSNQYANQYFFVPLQVSVDSQILFHSLYASIEEFIKATIESFSINAEPNDYLVFKHHPMDRGFNCYAKFIKKISINNQVSQRVFYCHDLNLPTLLRNAKGTITVNSTVGISSLQHYKPTKVMGQAIYDFEGLTSQKTLAQFWHSPCMPCPETFSKFRSLLKETNQINGSFYQQPEKILETASQKIFSNHIKSKCLSIFTESHGSG